MTYAEKSKVVAWHVRCPRCGQLGSVLVRVRCSSTSCNHYVFIVHVDWLNRRRWCRVSEDKLPEDLRGLIQDVVKELTVAVQIRLREKTAETPARERVARYIAGFVAKKLIRGEDVGLHLIYRLLRILYAVLCAEKIYSMCHNASTRGEPEVKLHPLCRSGTLDEFCSEVTEDGYTYDLLYKLSDGLIAPQDIRDLKERGILREAGRKGSKKLYRVSSVINIEDFEQVLNELYKRVLKDADINYLYTFLENHCEDITLLHDLEYRLTEALIILPIHVMGVLVDLLNRTSDEEIRREFIEALERLVRYGRIRLGSLRPEVASLTRMFQFELAVHFNRRGFKCVEKIGDYIIAERYCRYVISVALQELARIRATISVAEHISRPPETKSKMTGEVEGRSAEGTVHHWSAKSQLMKHLLEDNATRS